MGTVTETIPLGQPASRLSLAEKQLVLIARSLLQKARVLILDEPTAALNENDSENLLDLLRDLKKQGISCIMISHKLKEVIAIADKATVLRDGETICTLDAAKGEINEAEIIKNMVGREIEDVYPKRSKKKFGDKILELINWSAFDPKLGRYVAKDVNIHVKQGEIVGIAGLMGAGRTELAMSIFGKSYGKKISGQMLKDGQEVHFNDVSSAIEQGIAYVSEDRKGNGLILMEDIKQNITLASLSKITKNAILDKNKELIKKMEILELFVKNKLIKFEQRLGLTAA